MEVVDNVPDSLPRHSSAQEFSAEKNSRRNMEASQQPSSRQFLDKSAQGAESSSTSAVQRGRPRRSSSMRYVRRSHYMQGDRVIACVCDQRLGSWRHGVVANLDRYPPRNEGRGQLSYPVLYRSASRTVMGYFNPFLCEMLYDTLRNSMGDVMQ
ncbi:hypothetical protein L226DRAFT_525684 [Lentinus tigrinus ALCF2SS1-7]|uniref:Uncharacterized protein n=1 Tax=Lentinus tigrinus ALCF2SS1-6 TaxID=1328759 RepID=A0A5C2SDE7_9APHY|nr:hypothetical protein L227DRAFT_564135 [Lentinus tigrinus ALCF2SS1-6]RPD70766.1 hypothetical protein L226DRAFT_525684 [Lentinus tigrinus ALCF2SS1-7]